MNTPTRSNLPLSTQETFRRTRHIGLSRTVQRRNMRVVKPEQGTLFETHLYNQKEGLFVLAGVRRWSEFFPRLFRVNRSMTQTFLYGHFCQRKWLDCNLYNKREFFVNLRFDEKCFIELLGWNYLEFCEEQANASSFPFNHFLWWCNNINASTDKHFCGR